MDERARSVRSNKAIWSCTKVGSDNYCPLTAKIRLICWKLRQNFMYLKVNIHQCTFRLIMTASLTNERSLLGDLDEASCGMSDA